MSTSVLNPPNRFQTPPASDNGIVVGGPDSLYEVIDGVMVEKPMSKLSGRIATKLTIQVGHFAESNHFGRLATEVLFKLTPTARRTWRPDVAFISYERWPKNKTLTPDDPWEVVPELMIEVLSPTNIDGETRERLRAYFAAGVRSVWLVYPMTKEVYLYDSPTSVRILQSSDEIDGGSVLPGLKVPLASLFEDVPATA